jgi:hypothetical protein
MYKREQIQSLPKVEVSFQDDFCGCETEIKRTPRYLLRKLNEVGIVPKIGDEILLFEKDENGDGNEYYLCNIGKIVEATYEAMKNYQELNIPVTELATLDDKAILLHFDRDGYFDLPISDPVFSRFEE